jgi:hypothetical protein
VGVEICSGGEDDMMDQSINAVEYQCNATNLPAGGYSKLSRSQHSPKDKA